MNLQNLPQQRRSSNFKAYAELSASSTCHPSRACINKKLWWLSAWLVI